jgi:hypothetical protein
MLLFWTELSVKHRWSYELLGGLPHLPEIGYCTAPGGSGRARPKVESRADQDRGKRDRFLYSYPRESANSQIFWGGEHKLPLRANRAIF